MPSVLSRVCSSFFVAVALISLVACGGPSPTPDPSDASTPLDGGPGDAGSLDAGALDAGVDAGQPDAGIDAGLSDAGDSDAGEPDAGVDGGQPDAGVPYFGPFSTVGESFASWQGDRYRTFFVQAVNLGASRPGAGPRDLDVPYDTWMRWFGEMRDIGFNAMRVYSLQAPAFYKALRTYNTAHPDSPLLLIQGVYLDENHPDGTLDLIPLSAAFDSQAEEAVDCVHGDKVIAQRAGAAWGTFDSDVSSWTLAWLPGREVLATEVVDTDRRHPEQTSFEGQRLRIASGSASEVWMAQRIDHLADYELRTHEQTRPIAWSNWLELDPLHHPTEGRASGKDIAQVDLGRIDPFGLPAGYFVSYHVYPYYPDFVSEDPVYRTYSDALGPNSYRGILEALRTYHAGLPLLIAEFGVPSSWGRAHTSYSGMHHGGLSETDIGVFGARMLRDIHDVGAAGGAYFQWADGWWKRIWITNSLAFPADHLPLWHDMMNAQQHYGVLAFDPDPPDFGTTPAATGTGRVREVWAGFNAEFVQLKIQLDRALTSGERLVIGFDTYADDRGDRLLPNGQTTTRRNEFALTVTAPNAAELKVLRPYDLYSIRNATPATGAVFHSVASDAGDWTSMSWLIAAAHGNDDRSWWVPAENHPIGILRTRTASDTASSLDSVVLDGNSATVRVPWLLLNFTDPTQRRVMDDDLTTTATRETTQTPGIAFSVSVGNSLVETSRVTWSTWTRVPTTHERLKQGVPVLSQQLSQYQGWTN